MREKLLACLLIPFEQKQFVLCARLARFCGPFLTACIDVNETFWKPLCRIRKDLFLCRLSLCKMFSLGTFFSLTHSHFFCVVLVQ